MSRERTSKRWTLITLTMPSVKDLKRGMDISTTFEDRHKDHPPMFFFSYEEENAVVITVFTDKPDANLRRYLRGCGAVSVRISRDVRNVSWSDCHLYRAAVHLYEQKPLVVQNALQGLLHMLHYDTGQAATTFASIAGSLLSRSVRLPHSK